MIQVTCSCGKTYNVPARFAGRKGKCPACGNPVQVTRNAVSGGSRAKPAPAAPKISRPGQDETPEKRAEVPEGSAGYAEPVSNPSEKAESAPSEPAESAGVPSGWKDSLVGSLVKLKEAAREKAGTLQKSARRRSKTGPPGATEESDNKKLIRNLKWAVIVLPVVCVLFLSWFWIKGSQAEKDYREMMAGTQNQKNLRLVEREYQNYVSKHPKSRYAEEVGLALKELPDRIESQEFENTMKKMEEMGEAYEEKEKELNKFLSLHPNGKHTKQVQTLLGDMPAKIAERDFFKLKEQLERPILDLKKAENMVWEYLTTYPKEAFEEDAKALLHELPGRYEQEAFKKLNEDIEQLGDRYEETAPLYKAYLGKHMYGTNYGEVQERLAKIPDLIDDRDFSTILDTEWESLDDRMGALREYLRTHPEGRHINEAQKLIDQYPLEYAREKKKELAELEEQGRLEEAVVLSREFLKAYPGHRDVLHFKNANVRFERLLIPERAGGDTVATINAYNSFIRRYPGHVETEKAKEARGKLVAEFEEQTWREALARPGATSKDPTAYSQAMNDYLRLFSNGKHVQEVKERVAELERSARVDRAEGEWAKTRTRVSNVKSLKEGLDVLEKYLSANPNSRYRKEAQQEIIRIELKRFQGVAPFASEEEPQKVLLNDGTSLTGTVRRTSSGQITLTSLRGDRYYLGPDKIKGLEITTTGKMMRQYNESLKQLTPKRPDSYAKLAEWCLQNGFREKALLLNVIAAYLNPADSTAVRRLQDAKFTFSNGRWRSSDGLWR